MQKDDAGQNIEVTGQYLPVRTPRKKDRSHVHCLLCGPMLGRWRCLLEYIQPDDYRGDGMGEGDRKGHLHAKRRSFQHVVPFFDKVESTDPPAEAMLY